MVFCWTDRLLSRAGDAIPVCLGRVNNKWQMINNYDWQREWMIYRYRLKSDFDGGHIYLVDWEPELLAKLTTYFQDALVWKERINHHSSLDTRSHLQYPQQIRQQTPSRKYFCSHYAHVGDVSHLLLRQCLGIGEKSGRSDWKSPCRADGDITIAESSFDVSGVRTI